MRTKSINRVLLSSLAVVAVGALYFSAALPADAQVVRKTNAMNNSSSTASSTKPKMDVSCVSAAVEVREDALMTAWTSFDEDIATALTARKTALMTAWDSEVVKDRNAALKTAWKNWRGESKAAHTELRKERKMAWENFKKTVKAECKVTLPKEETLEKTASDTVAL